MNLNKIQLISNVLLLSVISVCFIVYPSIAPQFIPTDHHALPQLTVFLLNIGWLSLILPSSVLVIGLLLLNKPPVYSWCLNQCTWLLVLGSVLLILIGGVLPYIPMCATV